MFNSIVEALVCHAEKKPRRICIVDDRGENTYEDIRELSIKCAEYMKMCGVKKGSCVVVECTQDSRFLICAFSCQLMGAIFVPVENKAIKERIDEILKETEAVLLLYDNNVTSHYNMMSVTDFFEGLSKLNTVQVVSDWNSENTEDVSEVLYTTGTTGKPRGIVLTNANNIAIAENIKYGTKMKDDSVELIPLPLSHSHGLRSCYADILNGSTIVLVSGVMNVKRIFELIARYKVSALDLSPNAAKILLKLSKGGLNGYASQIDFIQIGTAMLDENLKNELCNIFPNSRLYNFYGSTESGRVCVLDFNAERGKIGCIGSPARHAKCVITDEKRQIIRSSKENTGLLAISGKMNMKRYIGSEELTQEVMHNGYIYTNDIGYIDENGEIYVLGRIDDVINYKGIKIVPEEIETYVLKYNGVSDCACIGVEDELCGYIPKVFVVVKNKENFDASQLLKFLETYIESNKMPKLVEIIDEIPRTSNGKILRRKLRS